MPEEQVIATRMELLKLKQRLKLAKKGYDLLKKKLDVLIIELFRILKNLKDVRAKVNTTLKEAQEASIFAALQYSEMELKSFAVMNRLDYQMEIKEKNIMGVRVPEIKFNVNEQRPYTPFLSSVKIDFLVKSYRKIIAAIIELAEVETAVKKLLYEIEKTRRRVNALEYVIIPQIQKQIKEVSQRLDEMERDMFVSLKAVKRNLEKKNA